MVRLALYVGFIALPPIVDDCDLARVEDGLYCESCNRILGPDEIAEKEFCSMCFDFAKENGEEPVRAKKIKVCVRVYYACPVCGEKGRQGQKCADCDENMQEFIDRAKIVFRCPVCGFDYEEEGECEEEECGKAKLKRTCEKSGTYPHVGRK